MKESDGSLMGWASTPRKCAKEKRGTEIVLYLKKMLKSLQSLSPQVHMLNI